MSRILLLSKTFFMIKWDLIFFIFMWRHWSDEHPSEQTCISIKEIDALFDTFCLSNLWHLLALLKKKSSEKDKVFRCTCYFNTISFNLHSTKVHIQYHEYIMIYIRYIYIYIYIYIHIYIYIAISYKAL